MKDLKNNIAFDCIDKHAISWHNPHKEALIAFDENLAAQKLTYLQLQGLTHRAAHALQSLGLQKGDRLLLRLNNEAIFPITFLGAIRAGIIPIPVSPLLSEDELNYLLKDSQASALVTHQNLLSENFLQQRPQHLKEILVWTKGKDAASLGTKRWQDLIKDAKSQFETLAVELNDPAYGLYTSGTTGEPKAAIHSHKSIRAHDTRAKRWQDVKTSDIIFNTSALNWSYALTAGLLDMWRHGLTSVIYQGPPSTEKICQILKRSHVSIFMSVPGLYRRLTRTLADFPRAFSEVRVCLSAGESLSQTLKEKFHQLTKLSIYEGLGMSENSVYLIQDYGQEAVPGSVGKSVFGDQIKILREDLSPADPEETGILATRQDCPGLMLGYHSGDNKIEKPFQTYQDASWFLSGDLAYQDDQGNFFFVGRRDDVITAGGYRIHPLEVEKILKQHPQILETAVIEAKNKDATYLAAHVVLNSEDDPDKNLAKDIQDFAAKHLAAYKIPKEITFCENLPKTITGKLKRRAL